MKIVLAHDSVTQLGGAERVAFEFHEMFPDAPFLTIVTDVKFKSLLTGWKVSQSPLQALYEFHPKFQHWLVLIPWAVDNLSIPDADVVLSSSSFFIKGLRKPKQAVHINYCHTPTRFLWIDADYVNQEVPMIIRPFVKFILKWFRTWDKRAAARVDYFIANSKEVQRRIKEIYNRDSEVIYPFIDDSFWKPSRGKGNYFLIAGRLQPHKGNELVIEAFNELGLPLHVVGTGRQEEYLRSIAKPNVTFLGRVTDAQLRDEYSGAQGFIYPQLEDFGLMPLEAAACGTATLAYGKGGALEAVEPGVTGSFFPSQSKDEIIKAVRSWDKNSYQQNMLIEHARKFGKAHFQSQILEFINKVKPRV